MMIKKFIRLKEYVFGEEEKEEEEKQDPRDFTLERLQETIELWVAEIQSKLSKGIEFEHVSSDIKLSKDSRDSNPRLTDTFRIGINGKPILFEVRAVGYNIPENFNDECELDLEFRVSRDLVQLNQFSDYHYGIKIFDNTVEIENIENFLEDIRKELTVELSKFIDLAMEVMSSGEVLLKEILFENEEEGGTESGEKKISSILELKQTISDVIESLFLKHELFEIKEPIEVLAGDEISVSIRNPDSKLILELYFSLLKQANELVVSIYPSVNVEDESLNKDLLRKLSFSQNDIEITENLESELLEFIDQNLIRNESLMRNIFVNRDYRAEVEESFQEAFTAGGLVPVSKISWGSSESKTLIPLSLRVEREGVRYDIFAEMSLSSPGIHSIRIEYVKPPARGLGIGATVSGEYFASFGDDMPLFLKHLAEKIGKKIDSSLAQYNSY